MRRPYANLVRSLIVSSLLFGCPDSYAGQEYYTVQAGSHVGLNQAQTDFKQLDQELPDNPKLSLRIERLQGYYTVRVGKLSNRRAARELLQAVKSIASDAILLKATIQAERIVVMEGTSDRLDSPAEQQQVQRQPGTENKMFLAEETYVQSEGGAPENSGRNEVEKKTADGRARAAQLAVQQDDKRPPDQFTTYVFGRPLTIGGEYEIEPKYRRDFSLGEKDDDLFRLDQGLDLEFLYAITPNTALFLEGKASHEAELYTEDDQEDWDGELKRGETWLYFDYINGTKFGLQIGRQNFRDKREWWWDEDIDGIRLHYHNDPFRFEIALAQELGRVSTKEDDIDPEKEDVLRLLGFARWDWARKQRIEAFFLKQNDSSSSLVVGQTLKEAREDEIDADFTWFGLRAMGRWKLGKPGKLYYWIDTGFVDGEEIVYDFDDAGGGTSEVTERISRDVRGSAFDIGGTWLSKVDWLPTITLGYAQGSGDRYPDDGRDRSYRQTGLQDNNWRFRGVDRFRYYGEMLRPELSNLRIWTLALGRPLFQNSSIEFLYHTYKQVHPEAGRLRDADLKAETLGRSRDVGDELDIVLGLEEWKHWEIEFVGGFFKAGDAFGPFSGESASTLILKVNYNF